MKKKGFTLIELLAVIVILAVIALIATPLIMNVINDAKKNSFKDSAYGIIKAVEFRVAKEQTDQVDGQNKEYKVDVTSDAITYSGDKPTSGWAHIDENGKVELYMCNASYCASKAIDSDEVTITSDSTEMETIKGEITRVSELNITMLTKDGSEGGYVKPVNNCTFDGELTQGAEYVNGQYTYRYMQEMYNFNWRNLTTEGWSVRLTDKTSTDPVTTKLCTSINGKPIVSMNGMFSSSKAPSIDVSSFDTSNVTNMSGMFAYAQSLTSLDLSNFDTSSVTDMTAMFYGASDLISIDLSNFDTSNVTQMDAMFNGDSSLTSIDLSSFNTSNVIDMAAMFYGTSSLTSIDLSSFDMSNVTNTSGMLTNTSATTGYAKTQADADKLNASDGKPSTLTFTVKQ